MVKGMGSGWHFESNRHSLASRGVKTGTLRNVFAYKFSDTAQSSKPRLEKTLTSGENIKTIGEFLKFQYSSPHFFGTDNLTREGKYRLMGWAFDFKPYLKRFVYNQYGRWAEIYAPNKTAVRKVVYGRINQIQEIEKGGV